MTAATALDELTGTAYHEAGHIAAAVLLGGEDAIHGGASIVRDEWTRGSASVGFVHDPDELADALNAALAGLPVDIRVRDAVERDAMITLAGRQTYIVAARRHGRFVLPAFPELTTDERLDREIATAERTLAAARAGVRYDDLHVDQLLGSISADAHERTLYRAWLEERTRAFVDAPGLWPLVDALAAALLARRELTRAEVLDTVRAFTHPDPGEVPFGTSGSRRQES